MLKENMVYLGDCLEVMQGIDDKSIDMILCDLPYGITACEWDCVIPLEDLWNQYKRIIKDIGVIVLFGSEPFASYLRLGNIKDYKYDWYYIKSRGSAINFVHAKNMPLRRVECVCVFSSGGIKHQDQVGRMAYYPQDLIRVDQLVSGTRSNIEKDVHWHRMQRDSHREKYIQEFANYPDNILVFKGDVEKLHPTQKPVALCEYLIKTYTNKGDLVLDNCAGSGTTALACMRSGRRYILIEKDPKYVDVCKHRILNEGFNFVLS